MFDDFYLFDGSPGRVVEGISTGEYYSVTWQNVSMYLDTPFASDQSVQMIWGWSVHRVERIPIPSQRHCVLLSIRSNGEVQCAYRSTERHSRPISCRLMAQVQMGTWSPPQTNQYPFANQVIPQGKHFFFFVPTAIIVCGNIGNDSTLTAVVPEPHSIGWRCTSIFALICTAGAARIAARGIPYQRNSLLDLNRFIIVRQDAFNLVCFHRVAP